ncbi:LysM peptidoglycan-binding domain-containing protein [Rhodococcus sp. D2-41]|uniref:LysM peptidoglycan-binding domain-containing protein n=1 Tax=Speluncibacter jeojiensis TaxID=2710754 RepID=A0A9X4RES7_9ACTN|nr:LysM domain-containing protein [Rhodococcus sp. D2-41]MDG3009211.1 LysM peptidoglycan-binding domain-containing protein [Rhodococcus sp. D2-41]MDG3016114.1 LysM peptidoglycan-binding domain-containing protein [Corynebacteriales bacterium D3-21]
MPADHRVHVVAEGESLAEIATCYDTTISTLRACNELSERSRLRAGQHLVVPQPTVHL